MTERPRRFEGARLVREEKYEALEPAETKTSKAGVVAKVIE